MSGLNLKMGLGGVAETPTPTYSNAGMSSVTQAAFGPGVTMPTESGTKYLGPGQPTGMALWVGVAAVVALACIRYSLPN